MKKEEYEYIKNVYENKFKEIEEDSSEIAFLITIFSLLFVGLLYFGYIMGGFNLILKTLFYLVCVIIFFTITRQITIKIKLSKRQGVK